MTVETGILIVVTLANAGIVVDRWVHRRERREAELASAASGNPSLKTRIDNLEQRLTDYISGARVRFDEYEKLRLERASIIAKELADLHASIVELHQKASDFGSDQQRAVGEMSLRVAKLEVIVERRKRDVRPNGEQRRR